MTLARLCAVAALLLAPASGQLPVNVVGAITVTPAHAGPADVITVHLDGNLPDPCFSDPVATPAAVAGNSLFIALNSAVASGACPQVLVPFSKTLTFGPFAPGTYSFSATLFGSGVFVGQLTPASVVVSDSVPAASTATLIAMAAGLLLLRYRFARSG